MKEPKHTTLNEGDIVHHKERGVSGTVIKVTQRSVTVKFPHSKMKCNRFYADEYLTVESSILTSKTLPAWNR